MSEPAPPSPDRLQLAAALLASSVIGAPIVIATAVQTVLFLANPRALDVTHPAAYEVEIGGALALAALGAVVAVVVVFRRLAAVAGSRAVLRVPYMILGLQIVFAVVALGLFLLAPGL